MCQFRFILHPRMIRRLHRFHFRVLSHWFEMPLKRKRLATSDGKEVGPSPSKRLKRAKTSESGPQKTRKTALKGAPTEDDNYVFFFKGACIYSQFHPSIFKDENGTTFTCMEQYMHFHKAEVFKDKIMSKAIMGTANPKQHKMFGRKVGNFDPKIWGVKSTEVVRDGSFLKYKQNPHMKAELFATYPKTLVEASPFDRLWGVGLSQYNDKIHDPKNWRGKNLLGKTLTEVRDTMMKEEGIIDKDGKRIEESIPETKTADTEPKPADKETKSADKETKSADKETKLADKETNLADKEIKPADKETKAADKETKPADKETKPADKGTKPADKETKPADKETKKQKQKPQLTRKQKQKPQLTRKQKQLERKQTQLTKKQKQLTSKQKQLTDKK